MKILKKIFAHNYFAILYFNFKMLPLRQALKLPFDFYYNIRFENLTGKIILKNKNIKRAMIKIGGRGSEMFTRSSTIVDIKGVAEFTGTVELGHGILLRIEEKGKLYFGENVRIGAMSKIFCQNKIVFENEIDLSWECQVFDTNFHYIRDLKTGVIDGIVGDIYIGSKNWFGNRITVMKGTKTPNNFIVASNSLCNKDYTYLPFGTIIGGIPAKKIGSNKERVFENLENISLILGNNIGK